MSYISSNLESVTNRLMPVPIEIYRSFNTWWLFIGCFSLYGYVLFKLPENSISGIFILLMLLAFFVSVAKAPESAKWDPCWYFVIAAFVISIFIYLWSNIYFPEYAGKHPSSDNLLNLCIFFPVAWWLGGKPENVLRLLMIAIIGFGIYLLIYGTWAEVVAGLYGERVDFSMRNSQHAAIFFSVAFMGWVLLIQRIIGKGNKPQTVVRLLIWLAGIVVLGVGCIITQTRAAWIGVLVALIFVAVLLMVYRRFSYKQLIIGLALFVMLSAVLIYPLMEVRIQRFEDDKLSINQLYAGDIENVPYSSMGIRLHTWVEAWKWIKQRPITGWDYSIRKHVFAESKALPPQIIKRVGHFHNSYIEVLLSYGIIGILYIFSLFYMVMRETWRAWRLGILPGDIFLFGVAFAIFWVIVNFSESYFLWSTGVYLMALVGGCMYTFPLSMRLRT